MEIISEFQVNKFISLKLIRARWVKGRDTFSPSAPKSHRVRIYLNDEPFRTCAYLLLVNPHLKENQEKIRSIDEAKEFLKDDFHETLQAKDFGITPEEEFWGHCSNIQAWIENDYDTRLLHSNLAFPLLKELKELGDPKAKVIFEEEVLKRYAIGNEKIQDYLFEKNYIQEIPWEKQISIVKHPEVYEAMVEIGTLFKNELNLSDIYFEEGKVTGFFPPSHPLKNNDIDILFKLLKSLKHMDFFSFSQRERKVLGNLPETLGELNQIKTLALWIPNHNNLPNAIGNLTSLEKMYIRFYRGKTLPNSIGKLQSLKVLEISDCPNLERFPESFGNLGSLEQIKIEDSNLKKLPESIGNLKNLKYFSLRNNNLNDLPKSFTNLKKLKTLFLDKNKFKKFPEIIKTMNLIQISLFGNPLNNQHINN
jgi:hypothetical protein